MAGRMSFGLKDFAVASILFLLIRSNSSEKFDDNARTLHMTKDTMDSARTSSPIDINRRLGLGNEWPFVRNRRDVSTITESNPIIKAEVEQSYMSEAKKRKKRVVFLLPLLPLLPLLQGAVAAVGIGAAATGALAVGSAIESSGPLISIPRFTSSYQPESATYMEGKKHVKDKVPTGETSEPRKGQLPSGQIYHPAPKTDEIAGFPGLVELTPKTSVQGGGGKRKRWRDAKNRKTYEWDSRHGELEGYRNSDKEHIGSFDHRTAEQTKKPVPGRKLTD